MATADHPRCLSPAGPWCDGLADALNLPGSGRPGLAARVSTSPLGRTQRAAGIVYRPEPGAPAVAINFCPFCAAPLAAAATAESGEAHRAARR